MSEGYLRRRGFFREISFCFFSALITGCLIHAFMLTQKISYHDDAETISSGVGVTFSSGRWALEYLGRLVHSCFGMNASIPAVNGTAYLACIGLASGIICREFRIQGRKKRYAVSALMTAFPTVAATFAYMFTAPYYFFALLLSTIGGAGILRGMRGAGAVKSVSALAAGSFCVAFAMGIYQAYLVPAICVVYLGLLMDSFDRTVSVKRFMGRASKGAGALMAGMAGYLVLNNTCLRLQRMKLSGYQGLDSMNTPSLKRLWGGIFEALRAFGDIFAGNYMGFYGGGLNRVLCVVLGGFSVCFALRLLALERSVVRRWIQCLLLLVSPLAFHAIEIFTANGDGFVHGLMVYGSVFWFILPVLLSDQGQEKRLGTAVDRIFSWADRSLSFFLILLTVCFGVLSNQCYFKSYIYQEQAKLYYNRMIVRMEEQEGYYPGIPVFFYGDFSQDTFCSYSEFDSITITGYDGYGNSTMVANYRYDLERFLPTHNNWPWESGADVSGIDFGGWFDEMPAYPQKGCMKVVNGVLIVKLAE